MQRKNYSNHYRGSWLGNIFNNKEKIKEVYLIYKMRGKNNKTKNKSSSII